MHVVNQYVRSVIRTDRALTLIETTHNLWLRQLDIYNRQRAALELRYMTEDILSVKDLIQIIQDAQLHNLHTPTLNWYYSYVKIEPLWRDDKILVFRANFPLTDRHLYLRYHTELAHPRKNNFNIRGVHFPFYVLAKRRRG